MQKTVKFSGCEISGFFYRYELIVSDYE